MTACYQVPNKRMCVQVSACVHAFKKGKQDTKIDRREERVMIDGNINTNMSQKHADSQNGKRVLHFTVMTHVLILTSHCGKV